MDKLTDDDLLEAEGDYDKFLGVVQKRYGDQKERVEQWTKEWYSKRERDEIIAKKATVAGICNQNSRQHATPQYLYFIQTPFLTETYVIGVSAVARFSLCFLLRFYESVN